MFLRLPDNVLSPLGHPNPNDWYYLWYITKLALKVLWTCHSSGSFSSRLLLPNLLLLAERIAPSDPAARSDVAPIKQREKKLLVVDISLCYYHSRSDRQCPFPYRPPQLALVNILKFIPGEGSALKNIFQLSQCLIVSLFLIHFSSGYPDNYRTVEIFLNWVFCMNLCCLLSPKHSVQPCFHTVTEIKTV